MTLLELDLPSVIQNKANIIQKHPDFLSFCQDNFNDFKINTSESGVNISSKQYRARGCDLNNLSALKQILEDENIDLNSETLIICECVMVYLDPKAISPIIQFFGSNFTRSAFMDYEMFNAQTNFGKMMIKNFAKRGLTLDAIDNFKTLPQISQMYLAAGFDSCQAFNMNTIFKMYIPPKEVQRVRKLEWLDEWEELTLMQDHYFISIAKKSGAESEAPLWFQELGFDTIKK